MSDNIPVPSLGRTVATDEIGGIHWPLTKLAFGVDGVATPVDATHGVPVALDGVQDGLKTLGWAAGTGNAIDATGFATLLIGVTVLTGSPVITVTGSISGTTQHSLAIFDESPAQANLSQITAAGMYSVSGNGLISYAITGGTATVNAMLKRA